MDTSGIGRRIAYWRVRRGYTQTEFGRLMGKGLRWVQSLEGGQRQADPRVSVLDEAARVLGVPLEELLSDCAVSAGAAQAEPPELAAIRTALQHPGVVTGINDDVTALTVDELRRHVAYGWSAFQATGYAPVAQILPQLLVDASRTARHMGGDAQRTAYALLSMAYQLAVAVTTKLGDHDLAHRAADRAVTAAERSEDPVAMTGAARHLVDAMFHRGEGAAAIAIATAVAQRLEPDLLYRGPSGLSVLGMLHLKAAVAAAHIDDRHEVPVQLAAAKVAAERLKLDGNALWTAFGPTNVTLHRVSTMVRLDQGPEAVAAADVVDQGALGALPRERRANHLVDRALGYRLAGRREQAVDTLLEAERLAPQEVRSRPASTRLVADLRLLGAGPAEGRLRALALRCGLPA